MKFGRVNPSYCLEDQAITGLGNVFNNYLESDLVGFALDRREGTLGIGSAFLVSTGEITGRLPKDKYLVATPNVKDVIWWENIAEMSQDAFEKLYDDMITHMSGQDYFVQDLYAGSDRVLSFNIRFVTELAWHSLFIRHLLRRPERSDLDDYLAKCTLINCPSFRCNPARH